MAFFLSSLVFSWMSLSFRTDIILLDFVLDCLHPFSPLSVRFSTDFLSYCFSFSSFFMLMLRCTQSILFYLLSQAQLLGLWDQRLVVIPYWLPVALLFKSLFYFFSESTYPSSLPIFSLRELFIFFSSYNQRVNTSICFLLLSSLFSNYLFSFLNSSNFQSRLSWQILSCCCNQDNVRLTLMCPRTYPSNF